MIPFILQSWKLLRCCCMWHEHLLQLTNRAPPPRSGWKANFGLSCSSKLFISPKTLPAVYRGDTKCAHVLVNYQANATLTEPSSGMSALTIAFSATNEPMARLLLQYGANPDVKDSKGKSARSLAEKHDMKHLINDWDEFGAQAFEVRLLSCFIGLCSWCCRNQTSCEL